MSFVTIRTFDNYFNAHIILTKLQDAGISCYLNDEFTVTIYLVLSNAIGGIKLVVGKEDKEEAVKLLAKYDEEFLSSVPCPRCHECSLQRINKPGAANFIIGIVTWLISSYAIAPEQVYQCSICGFESRSLPE